MKYTLTFEGEPGKPCKISRGIGTTYDGKYVADCPFYLVGPCPGLGCEGCPAVPAKREENP